MLQARSAETVRATLPIVRERVGAITDAFYQGMFDAHPELLRDLFNRGNQANGTQRRALAAAFVAFADVVSARPGVDPARAAGGPNLDRIAHKHVSLGLTADQYPIVREHLLRAVRTVLGDSATSGVLAAWQDVYDLLAARLIGAEAELYAAAGVAAGDVWREYLVIGRRRDAEDVLTLALRPTGGRPTPGFAPGQYVSVRVELPDGARQARQYSVLGATGDSLQISVKRLIDEPAGEVSTHLHTRVGTGDALWVSTPSGDVTLREGDEPLLLASAGIGYTPLRAMLTAVVASGSARQVLIVHGDRDEHADPWATDREKYLATLPNATAHVWYEYPDQPWPATRTGHVDLRELAIPTSTTAYLCGPTLFLRALARQLREAGIPQERVRYEVFGPDTWLGEGPS